MDIKDKGLLHLKYMKVEAHLGSSHPSSFSSHLDNGISSYFTHKETELGLLGHLQSNIEPGSFIKNKQIL